jgi:cutinase
MVKALRQKLGADKVTVQGVDYPADAAVSTNHFLTFVSACD